MKHGLLSLLCVVTLVACGGGGGSDAGGSPNSTSSGGNNSGTTTGAMLHDDVDKPYNGINMWYLDKYVNARIFTDVMTQAGPDWHLGVAPWSTVAMDELGWPKADAGITIWNCEFVADGTYSLVFTGKAKEVRLQATDGVGGATGVSINQALKDLTYDAASNTSRATVTLRGFNTSRDKWVQLGGLVFNGTQRTADSPVGSGITNVHLYRPGYDGSQMFTHEFLNDMKNFQLIRYMEWNRTNTNPSSHWSDRPLPEHANQMRTFPYPYPINNETTLRTGHLGVAYEYMIAASNASNTDMWITVPTFADDDYVENLAKLIRDGRTGANGVVYAPLKPNLRVYVEYSNEFFNFMTPVLNWEMSLSKAAQKDPNHPIMFDCDTNKNCSDVNQGARRYAAWRAARISSIFREAFGDAQMMTRVRPVYETQIGEWSWLGAGLDFIDQYFGVPRNGQPAHPVNYFFYGAGGAGYYYPTLENHTDASYVQQHFFDDGVFPDPVWLADVKNDLGIIRKYGLKQVAYEGGLALNRENLNSAQDFDLMGQSGISDVMQRSHQAWRQAGGDVFVYYCYARNPSWGGFSAFTFDANYQPLTTPKMLAMQAINKAPLTPPTIGDAIPGTLVIREMDSDLLRGHRMGGQIFDAKPVASNAKDLSFGINAAKAGQYTLTLFGGIQADPASADAPANGIVSVYVNGGEVAGSIQLNAANKAPWLSNSTALTLTIPAGVSVIRLKSDFGFYVYSVSLAAAGATTQPPVTTHARTRYDFDGDGRADFFWRNTSTGQNQLTLMNGETRQLKTITDPNWRVVAVADFDDDKRNDILWQNTAETDPNKQYWFWKITNGTLRAEWYFFNANLTAPSSSSRLEGVGQPTGLGSRMIWRNPSDGSISFYGLNLSRLPIGYKLVGADWRLIGTGDVTQDGREELFWQNSSTGELLVITTGDNASWTANQGKSLGQFPGLSALTVGDFTGDGIADLLWRNTSNGQLTLWAMSDSAVPDAAQQLTVGTLGSDWQLAASADFNGDRRQDLLWHNTATNEDVLWLMNGEQITQKKSLGSNAGWALQNH